MGRQMFYSVLWVQLLCVDKLCSIPSNSLTMNCSIPSNSLTMNSSKLSFQAEYDTHVNNVGHLLRVKPSKKTASIKSKLRLLSLFHLVLSLFDNLVKTSVV